MLTLILVILLIISVVVTLHELGHFVTAKIFGVHVEEFGLGMFVRIFAKKIGDTVYSLNAIPMGGFVKLTGEDGSEVLNPKSFAAKPKWQKVIILSAGVFMNVVLAIALFTVAYLYGMPEWGGELSISQIQSGTPAEEVGLKTDDIVSQINGEKVDSLEKFRTIVQDNLGQKVDLMVNRGGEIKNFQILARENPPEGQGSFGVGLSAKPAIVNEVKYPWYQAPIQATKLTFQMGKEMIIGLVTILGQLFSKGQAPSDVAGPIGIGSIIGELMKFGVIPVVQFMAIISLNLALINILPFPALDGGRIFIILVEAITRRKIPAHIEGLIHAVGLALLMILLILVTYQDIVRILS